MKTPCMLAPAALAGLLYLAQSTSWLQWGTAKKQRQTAERQARTARNKLRLDLFERRFSVFEALIDTKQGAGSEQYERTLKVHSEGVKWFSEQIDEIPKRFAKFLKLEG